MYGLAFDVGTTTLAASLVNIDSGERVVKRGALNPQRQFGADVISRMERAKSSPATVAELRSSVNCELQQLAEELLKAAGVSEVSAAAFAGNPAMEHLLLGVPVDTLCTIPYRPLFRESKRLSLAELGWNHGVECFIFPLPGGFVGGDLVAFLFTQAGERNPDAPVLYLDIGTNGEIALVTGGRIFATSAAAGPAFEGGNLQCGMAALPGAITGVTFTGGTVRVKTLADVPAAGICGSGAIEAVAGLRRAGIIDATGRLLGAMDIPSNLAVRVVEENGQPAFVLHRDARNSVRLTQDDVRQVQLAKAAIRGGIEVLAARASIEIEDVAEVVVTGSFGSRLQPEHLAVIGILPKSLVERTRFVEEGALAGVEKMLCDPNGGAAVDALADRCQVVPLSGNPVFEREFLAHMNFPIT